MAYTNQALVENFLKRSLTTHEAASLAMLIPAIKAWIDLKTSTTFDNSDATTRLFPSEGGRIINIDPATNVTLVEELDDYGASVYVFQSYEHVLLPANDNVKNQIQFRYRDSFPGANRIRVTGEFGSYDNGVPEDIRMVATKLCALMLNHKVASGVKRESLEGHLIDYDLGKFATDDPLVMSVLNLHKEILIDDEDCE